MSILLYNLIFGLFNEVSIIVLGNKTDYDFPILSQIMDVDTNSDQGLISRFVFGSKETEDMGSKVSCGISDQYVAQLGEHAECTGNYDYLANYDYKAGKQRLSEILDNKMEVIEQSELPSDDSFTFSNGYYSWVSAIFIDMRVIFKNDQIFKVLTKLK